VLKLTGLIGQAAPESTLGPPAQRPEASAKKFPALIARPSAAKLGKFEQLELHLVTQRTHKSSQLAHFIGGFVEIIVVANDAKMVRAAATCS
jgi:hypothetical protein